MLYGASTQNTIKLHKVAKPRSSCCDDADFIAFNFKRNFSDSLSPVIVRLVDN